MGRLSWIARVVRLAESVRARFVPGPPDREPRWSDRPDLRANSLGVRRLEPRRVLSASIQSITVPPTAVEGDSVEVSAEATGLGDLTFDWTITRDGQVIAWSDQQTFSFVAPEDGAYDVNLRVIDDLDQGFDTASANIDVANAPPTLIDLTATAIDENGVTTLSGFLQDPGAEDTFEMLIGWGDPSSPSNLQYIDLSNPPPGVTFDAETGYFTVQHRYLDDNPTATPQDEYTIAVLIGDDDFGLSLDETEVIVRNVRPVVEELTATDIDENGWTLLTGTINDPGTLDSHTLAISWGDPNSPNNLQMIDLNSPPEGVEYNAQTGRFEIQHQYLDDRPGGIADKFKILVFVEDDDSGRSNTTTTVNVTNVRPTILTATATDTTEAGQTTLSGTFADPGTLDQFELVVDWGDGTTETFYYEPGTSEFSETHTYADDNPTGTPEDMVTIRLILTDDDGGVDKRDVVIKVANLAPTITGLAASAIKENEKTTLTGVIEDPGALDTHKLLITWGDEDQPNQYELIDLTALPSHAMYNALTGEFRVDHQYMDDNPTNTPTDQYLIAVKVVDDDTGVGEADTVVEVENVPPRLVGVAAEDVYENGVSVLQGRIDDPGSLDTFTLTVNWGDGVVQTFTTTPGAGGIDLTAPPDWVDYDPETRAFRIEHRYLDDAPTTNPVDTYQVRLTLVDDDDDMTVDAAKVYVDVTNLDPEINPIQGVEINEGGQVLIGAGGVLASFTDVGTLDTHTAVVDWGDGSPTESLTAVTSEGYGVLDGSHTYADDNANDLYTVTITLTDKDGGTAQASFDVTVRNLNPELTLREFTPEELTINEGDTLSLSELGIFTDAGAANPNNSPVATDETFYYTIDWGDGTQPDLHMPVAVVDGGAGVGKSGELLDTHTHLYADNDSDSKYTVTLTLHDDDGGYHERSFVVTVNNVNPYFEPLSESELLDDPYMAGILADAMDLGGEGTTMLVLRFNDPGADEFEVWIDWGDKLDLTPGDARFVKATPVDSVVTEKGVVMMYWYPYEGPPDPDNPANPITITAVVLDDDYVEANDGALIVGADTVFLDQPGRSDPAEAVITNPGTSDNDGASAIDTSADVALLELPVLEEYLAPTEQQSAQAGTQQSQDAASGGSDQTAVGERVLVIRKVLPDGSLGEPEPVKLEVLEDLPSYLASKDDGRYLFFLVRMEDNSSRLMLDVTIRGGKPVDVSDDSDGARDKPPTSEEVEQAPLVEPAEAAQQVAEPQALLAPPSDPRNANLLSSAGIVMAATIRSRSKQRPQESWQGQVEQAFSHADQNSWNRLNLLRRRPR